MIVFVGTPMPKHDRSTAKSGSPHAILLCRESANSGCEQSQQGSPLLDHLVGGNEQLFRHGDAEHPGGRVVYYQLELGRLQHRQLCRLRALEDAARVDAELMIGI